MTRPETARQTASAVLMVRPRSFGWNPETVATNRFQSESEMAPDSVAASALAEFDAFVTGLRSIGVDVHVIEDRAPPRCPDAIFPNNWASFHADGTVVLYPMLAPNRRMERRVHRFHDAIESGGFAVKRLLDLTHHELEGRYLEGTGSVVFDHVQRTAYACQSPRTDGSVLDELCAELGYRPFKFAAVDRGGVPVYHTNVMLAIGRRFALVCLDSIVAGDRERVSRSLSESGRELIEIDFDALESFAGNVLELDSHGSGSVLALSQRAADALQGAGATKLRRLVDRWQAAPIPTIERHGGGSVRCMLAEIFLPRAGASDSGFART